MAKVLLFFMFVTRVVSWTVDLGEVEKFLIDNEVLSMENSNENTDLKNVEDSTTSSEGLKDLDLQNFEEKVTSIIQNGSVYLEGLSKALMIYRFTLYNCSRNNSTSPNLDYSSNKSLNGTSCGIALNNTEYIQKLSELALLTTNKLRDKAYDKNYEDDDRDENELLLQLAWLLDRLAHLTGYEPNPKQYINNDHSPSKTNITENLRNKNNTEITESLEILEQTENGRPLSKLPPENLTTVKSVEKRSVEKPLENVVNYYVKFKVWNNSNPINNMNGNTSKDFDVENNLTVRPITKRSLKKIVILRRRVKNRSKK